MANKRTHTASFGTTARVNHDATAFYGRRMYASETKKPVVTCPDNQPDKVNTLYQQDSRDMHHLPDNSVHLMITSPPYNVGKDYDADLTLEEYKSLLRDVLKETYRVLVEGGRACVNIANVGRSPYLPLHAYLIDIALACGFFMRGEIIWDKGASAGTSCAWGSWQSASNPTLRDVHEYILVFCKGTFRRHPVRQNTISRDDFISATKSVWKFHAASAKKVKHPAPFPLELPLRLINLYSYEGDVVLDPFMGSGTTGEAAQKTGRVFIGYEVENEYIKVATKRLGLNDAKQSSLMLHQANGSATMKESKVLPSAPSKRKRDRPVVEHALPPLRAPASAEDLAQAVMNTPSKKVWDCDKKPR